MDYVSISRMKTYLNCPRKFKFWYVDKLPKLFKPAGLALGNVVHSTAEWLNRRLCEGQKPELDDVLKIFRSDWFSLSQDEIRFDGKENEDEMLAKAIELLKLLHERQTNGTQIREVEMPFQLSLVDRETGEILEAPLRGVFDWVESEDVLVEMKTSARVHDTDSSDNRLQLAAYDYAYREMFGRSPRIKVLNLLKTKEPKLLEKEILLDERDYQNLVGTTKLFLAGVQNRIFHPNKSFMCKNCEYAGVCEASSNAK